MIYLATFLLALCSIVYELLLGQTLSAFLGNTILRYSVTIGLYMCSMGFGSLLLPKSMQRSPLISLLKVEFCLSVVGGCSVLALLAFHMLGVEGMLFSIIAHSLIVLIGILTGFEIPLLMLVKNKTDADSDASVLGIDYLGAFAGTMLFAFLFYPHVGLVATSCILGAVNAIVGCSLIFQWRLLEKGEMRAFSVLSLVLFCVAIPLLIASANPRALDAVTKHMYMDRRAGEDVS